MDEAYDFVNAFTKLHTDTTIDGTVVEWLTTNSAKIGESGSA
jgi:hypothetical protein